MKHSNAAFLAFFCLIFVASGFRFAIISDVHIGKSHEVYKGQETEEVGHLRKNVEHIKELHQKSPIDFVLVSGDISDKAQIAMFQKVRDVLHDLPVRYLPMIGNHDVWSYHDDWKEPFPTGDKMFAETFAERYSVFGEGLLDYTGNTSVSNPQSKHPSHFQNFVIERDGLLILGLDWVSRLEGPVRAATNAELHDFPGGTLPWLNATLAELAMQQGPALRQVVLVQHHPFHCYPLIGWYACFTDHQMKHLQHLIMRYAGAGRVPDAHQWFGVLGGHLHRWYNGSAFHDSATTHGAFKQWRQWETPATRNNACLSVVHVDDGRIAHIAKWGGEFDEEAAYEAERADTVREMEMEMESFQYVLGM